MNEVIIVSIVYCVVLSMIFWYQTIVYKELMRDINEMLGTQFWTEKYLHKIVKKLLLEQQEEIMPVSEDPTPETDKDGFPL